MAGNAAAGGGEVGGRVDVVERVFGRIEHDRAGGAERQGVADLVVAGGRQKGQEVGQEGDRPVSDQVVLAAGMDGDRRRGREAAQQVGRDERRVDRDGEQRRGAEGGGPGEAGGDTGERAGAGERAVRQDRQVEASEPAGVAVGADGDVRGLWLQAGEQVGEQGLAVEVEQGFVGAAEAGAGAAGEDQGGGGHARRKNSSRALPWRRSASVSGGVNASDGPSSATIRALGAIQSRVARAASARGSRFSP